jgi:hypothetical protein
MATDSDLLQQIVYNRYRNALIWRNLWSILLFIFGASLILFAVVTIFFLIRQDWIPSALTVIGTIVEGAGTAWVVSRRNESVTEEKEALEEAKKVLEKVKTALRGSTKITDLQRKYHFF